MKIKVTEKTYHEVLALPKAVHQKPRLQKQIFRNLIAFLSKGELKATNFSYDMINMDKLSKDEPSLILMNHSSFTDLQIIGTVFKNRPYSIVCTNDGFIGKEGLMRAIGCIPTRKFITDVTLIKDMHYALHKLRSSVVMYPEASYSFDGSKTPLPESLGKCIKLLNVPVIMVRTSGAFLRDPLYNNLQKRKVSVHADISYLLSTEEIASLSADEINKKLSVAFEYDHFREQHENGVLITESFRADGLHRVLYKCPCCNAEGKMLGKGINITCQSCGDSHELLENGTLENRSGRKISFKYVTDWYKWERECVREEIENGQYLLDTEVDIMILSDLKSMYKVGSGRLIHDNKGFTLIGCDGALSYTQKPKASYSLYADYFWYEIGDMISIGDNKMQYYCFPKNQESTIVAKARLAAEEMHKKGC